MIIDFKYNFNTYEEKILNNYSKFKYTSPCCGAKHSLTRHAYYCRHIIYIENGSLKINELKILRVKCSSCNTTHAILPNDVIPYSIYSFTFTFQVLYLYYNKNKLKNKDILNKYRISHQVLYHLISKFIYFLQECILFLRTLNCFTQDPLEILEAIKYQHYHVENFLYSYFFNNRKFFLMKKYQNTIPYKIKIGICI